MRPETPAAGAESETAATLRLQAEYGRVCHALEHLKWQQAQLQAQGGFLQQETGDLQSESLVFLGFLSKWVQRHQGAVVSLSEQNQQALEELRQEQKQRRSFHREEEETLQKLLLQHRAKLEQLSSELQGLRWVQKVQQQQAARIQGLQQELAATRKKYVQCLQEGRTLFLQEKARWELEAQEQAHHLAQQVEAVAARCLLEYRLGIQRESQELRRELKQLVWRAEELRVHRNRLQAQLQQQQSCLQDLVLGSQPVLQKESGAPQKEFLSGKHGPSQAQLVTGVRI